MGSSGFKLLGSNPGSLLRSKSTRHERRCEAASECLVALMLLFVYRKQLTVCAADRENSEGHRRSDRIFAE